MKASDWQITIGTGPAPEGVTDKIYENSLKLGQYKIADVPKVDLAKLGSVTFGSDYEVEIIDSVSDYVILMKEIFE